MFTFQNFNNSACWNGNEDDLDDLDTELSIKSVNQSSTSSSQAPGRGVLAKRQLNKEQAQFNKFVREEVSKKFGEDFLLQHEVNQLESSVMDMIKSMRDQLGFFCCFSFVKSVEYKILKMKRSHLFCLRTPRRQEPGRWLKCR